MSENRQSSTATRVADWGRDPPRLRHLLPRGARPRRPLRRLVLHRGAHHRHLLPAVLPGDHAASARNVEFHPSAAAAQRAGFRACKRCRPDASPGSPEWDVRGDLAGRALRLIGDGVIDRDGVPGLAAAARLLRAPGQPHAAGRGRRRPARPGPRAAGADRPGPARDHRPAGRRRRVRGRLRERPAVQRDHAARSSRPRRPRLRADRRRGGAPAEPGTIALRLPYRAPMTLAATLDFLGARAIPGVETVRGRRLQPGVSGAPQRPGSASAVSQADGRRRDAGSGCTTSATWWPWSPGSAGCSTSTPTRRPSTPCSAPIPRWRRWSPSGPGCAHPAPSTGSRWPSGPSSGSRSRCAARGRCSAGIVSRARPAGVRRRAVAAVPDAAALAALDPGELPMPRARGRTLRRAWPAAIADGAPGLDPGADRDETRAALLGAARHRAVDGRLPARCGRWPTRTSLLTHRPRRAARPPTRSASTSTDGRPDWAPWRTYATHHLWAALHRPTPASELTAMTSKYTYIDSPAGRLLAVRDDGGHHRAATCRPAGIRRPSRARTGCATTPRSTTSAPSSTSTSPATRTRVRPAAATRPARRSSSGCGRRCARSPTARRRATARRPRAIGAPDARRGRSGWPTGRTRSRSSCRATGSSARTAR